MHKIFFTSLSLESATTAEVMGAVGTYHEEAVSLKARGIPPELTPMDAAMEFALGRLPVPVRELIEADRREFVTAWATITGDAHRARKAVLNLVPTCRQCGASEGADVHQPNRISKAGTKFWDVGRHGYVADDYTYDPVAGRLETLETLEAQAALGVDNYGSSD